MTLSGLLGGNKSCADGKFRLWNQKNNRASNSIRSRILKSAVCCMPLLIPSGMPISPCFSLQRASLLTSQHRQYRHAAHYNVTHLRRRAFYSLPSAHMELLSEPPFALPATFDAVDEAIDSNADLADAILATGLPSFGIEADDKSWYGYATPNDMEKARSTLRLFFRDWSAEGLRERNSSFIPILSALENHLPNLPPEHRHQWKILVPGAGLGRLVFDLCAIGYVVEGNEISYHQLLASNYILNCTSVAGQHRLFPWAMSFSNHLSRADQLQSVAVPDIHPANKLEADSLTVQSGLHYSDRMSMTAGDFCELYRRPDYMCHFDVVVTCFFIDTAPNVINYIETIKHCLKSNGLWINIGPLLWHFESAPIPAERKTQAHRSHDTPASHLSSSAGIGEPGSFELSNDELMALLERFDFEILEQKQAPAETTGYVQNPASMLQNVYNPSFWVARKGRQR